MNSLPENISYLQCHREVCDIRTPTTFFWSQIEHPAAGQGLRVWDSLPMALLVLRVMKHWGSYADHTQKCLNPYLGQAGVVPSGIHELSDPLHGHSRAVHWWADPGEGKLLLHQQTQQQFMNPKYTPLEAGEGIRILVILGPDWFRLRKPRDDQGTGVWVTSRPVTSWKWSLFTSATK